MRGLERRWQAVAADPAIEFLDFTGINLLHLEARLGAHDGLRLP
jgi:hypothetical protein